MVINGPIFDGLDAWHVLNSDLKKSLGFVAPFFAHGFPMWKHLSSETPAAYNAADALIAGINMRGTEVLLRQHGLWDVYIQYVQELDPVFSAMTEAGMPIDPERRLVAAIHLGELRAKVRLDIEALIPEEIRTISPAQGYTRAPADTTGLIQVTITNIPVRRCPRCLTANPPKPHFKVYKKKENPCGGLEAVISAEDVVRWARRDPFVLSPKSILRYMEYRRYPVMRAKGQLQPTTDEQTIRKLLAKYPKDPFFALVLDDREYTKLLGTYIGYATQDE